MDFLLESFQTVESCMNILKVLQQLEPVKCFEQKLSHSFQVLTLNILSG